MRKAKIFRFLGVAVVFRYGGKSNPVLAIDFVKECYGLGRSV
jgi:hypothetical protein